MWCGLVAAHFPGIRRWRGLEDVGVGAGVEEQTARTLALTGDADRPFERVPQGAAPGRARVPGQLYRFQGTERQSIAGERYERLWKRSQTGCAGR